MTDKSSYLILGGCGFIGRNLVQYLIDNDLASNIRVVDKVLPALAYLNKIHEETIIKNPIVEFMNANLLNKISLEKVFQNEIPFDYVINCAAETKFGLTDAVYHEGIVNLTTSCAKLAAVHNAKRFIEISCGRMANSKTPHKESDPTDPWTPIAKFKLLAEKSLSKIPDLKYTILRPAIVYGLGDKTGITPRLVVGSIYKHMNETMKILWNRNLVTNTIHVKDLCRAICFVVGREDTVSQVYNVVDVGSTTQGHINDIVSEIFNISTSYVENIFSSLYKLDFDAVIEEINDKHSAPWAEMCKKREVANTPLSSFLHKEDLYDKSLNLDGTKLVKLGFECQYPRITKELVLESLVLNTRNNMRIRGVKYEKHSLESYTNILFLKTYKGHHTCNLFYICYVHDLVNIMHANIDKEYKGRSLTITKNEICFHDLSPYTSSEEAKESLFKYSQQCSQIVLFCN